MARIRRSNDEPMQVRFIINGKGSDDHTDEEKDRERAYDRAGGAFAPNLFDSFGVLNHWQFRN